MNFYFCVWQYNTFEIKSEMFKTYELFNQFALEVRQLRLAIHYLNPLSKFFELLQQVRASARTHTHIHRWCKTAFIRHVVYILEIR